MNHDNDDDCARLPPQSMPLAAITMARSQGSLGRRLNCFLGLSLNDRTIIFLVILLDKTVSVG